MKKMLVFAFVLAIVGTVLSPHGSAVQSGGMTAQPWSKTCDMGAVGPDGCDVSVTMTPSTATCPDSGTAYCLTLSVACPGGEDPPEDCTSDTNCNVCGYDSTVIAVTCGGQCFSAKPKNGSSWDDCASDCGNMSARDSGHPCQ